MKRVKLHRSASVRMAVMFVLLFAAAIVIAFTALYVKIERDLDEHQVAEVLEVQQSLVGVIKTQTPPLTHEVLAKRLKQLSDEDTAYLLTGEHGELIAGNTKIIPTFPGWKHISWSTLQKKGVRDPAEPEEGVFGTWTDVPGGHLFVGTSDGDIIEARDMLVEGLGLAFAIAVAASLAGGVLLGLRARHRIEKISRVLVAVSDGNLSERISLKDKGDELDHISGRINATLDRLQGSIGSLRQVTTDIAHDLKSPIGRVRQRLQRAGQTESLSEYRAVVATTVIEIDKIVDTFNALLSIAQIEGGLQKQRFAPQSIQSVLETVIDAYDAVAEDAGHSLTSQLDALRHVEVTGDRDLLTQMFANLVENAIRHCAPSARICVLAEYRPHLAVVTISDDGPGIPLDERQNVFRRLYRLEKSRTTPGSGLGLALVAAIADLHDVKIDLRDNSPGLLVELRFPSRTTMTKDMAAE